MCGQLGGVWKHVLLVCLLE